MSTERWHEVTVGADFGADPRAWLAAQMTEGMPWLLAHADDGVIWGRREPDGALILSSDVFKEAERYPAIAVPLSAKTLQQARIFGPQGELLLWRTDSGFSARCIDDGPHPPDDALSDKGEPYLLWGRGRVDVLETREPERFVLISEGQQGVRHAPPKLVTGKRRLALKVRHYVDYDDQGQARIALSRLVDLV
jgi:CRISPR-associated protein (TIGR03984 family)